MTAFERTFPTVLHIEGGYSNNPNDAGAATKYGITERVARANGYIGDMRDLSIEQATRIAKSQYWDVLRLDEIADVDESVAAELFDLSYNMGVAIAGDFLQRSLNVLNRGATDYPDMTVDGVVGPVTIAALKSFVKLRGDGGRRVLLRMINCLRGALYISIAEKNPKNETFVYGWISQRIT